MGLCEAALERLNVSHSRRDAASASPGRCVLRPPSPAPHAGSVFPTGDSRIGAMRRSLQVLVLHLRAPQAAY